MRAAMAAAAERVRDSIAAKETALTALDAKARSRMTAPDTLVVVPPLRSLQCLRWRQHLSDGQRSIVNVSVRRWARIDRSASHRTCMGSTHQTGRSL